MTASTLKPQLRHALLRNLKAKQSCKKSWLQKGFTLVELMIVIVIVGILSAVALPNFLSQTDKAKATEVKTQASSYLKQYYAASIDDSTADVECPADTDTWDYTCDGASVTAVGKAGTSVAGKEYTASVDTSTGAMTMPSGLSG